MLAWNDDDETFLLEDDIDAVEIEDQRFRCDINLVAHRDSAKPHKAQCGFWEL